MAGHRGGGTAQRGLGCWLPSARLRRGRLPRADPHLPPGGGGMSATLSKNGALHKDHTASPPERIPAELRARPQWVTWRRESPPGSGRVMKMPVNPKTGQHAATTKPDTWASLEEAQAQAQRPGHNGVGFVF